VTDNGVGFEMKNNDHGHSGIGLAGIRNRIRLYDGTLDIKSKINKGTSVSIILKQFA
jgi:signal transduction histidine kinase